MFFYNSSVRLTSSNSDAAVEFSNVAGDSFRIEVIAKDHSAIRDVYAYTDPDGVVRLFSEAAREWRGWQGIKAWQSLEGELRLELSADRSGHITLRIQIWYLGNADEWRLDTDIGLEAGRLETIAQDARRLWNRVS